jgi:type VI secretion system ImpA family protein
MAPTPTSSSRPLNCDLDRLLAPISPEHPCGEWLRYEGTYDQVRDARREDDAGLPQGVWQSELKRADWGSVESVCCEALATRSKDLQLSAWLLEAWIQLDGLAGAARGLDLMRRICVAYWDEMYPVLDADMTARLAPLQWVNEKLSRRLRLLKLTQPSLDGVPAFSLADWDVAVQHSSGPGSGAGDRSGPTQAKIEQSVSLTSYSWFAALRQDTQKSMDEARALDVLLDEKAGKSAPGLLQFRGALDAIDLILAQMCAATRHQEPEMPLESSDGSEHTASAAALVPTAGPMLPAEDHAIESGLAGFAETDGFRLNTREDAYRVLGEVATFLQKIDPHSPTPYLVRRAVAWGSMQFGELMQELVRDQGEVNELVRLLHLDLSDTATSKGWR